MAEDGYVIDVNVTLRERDAFLDAIAESQRTQRDTLLVPHFAKFIKAWPFGTDPADPEAYLDLKITEWRAVTAKVLDAFQRLSAGG